MKLRIYLNLIGKICQEKNKKLWCLGFAFGDGGIALNNKIPTMMLRLCGKKTKYANRFEEVSYSVTYPTCYNGDGHVILSDIRSKELPYF